ncbi:MAG: hypothetical protein PHV82_08155, partial [Victivallaceae bacterium]|nr:hypothetical protein [Victivallaceae bacterium]
MMEKVLTGSLTALFLNMPAYGLNLENISNFSDVRPHMLIKAAGIYNLSGLCYSADGKKLYLGTGTKIISCDAHSGQILAVDRVPASVIICLSDDGKRLLCGGYNRIVEWDIEKKRILCDIENTNTRKVCYSRDCQKAVGVTINGRLRIFDLTDGKIISEYKIPDAGREITYASPSTDGKGIY